MFGPRRAEKRAGLLTEAVRVTGWHRKAVIRAWGRPVGARPRRGRPPGRAVRYGPVVVRALRAVWTATGYPWSVRLKALLPLWLPKAAKRLALTPAVGPASQPRIRLNTVEQITPSDLRHWRHWRPVPVYLICTSTAFERFERF
jgi:hypothetical protein